MLHVNGMAVTAAPQGASWGVLHYHNDIENYRCLLSHGGSKAAVSGTTTTVYRPSSIGWQKNPLSMVVGMDIMYTTVGTIAISGLATTGCTVRLQDGWKA